MPPRPIRIPGLPDVHYRTKFWFEVDGRFAIGEGGFELLRSIAERGSLSEAAKEIGWSYRHAWGYLRRAEKVLGASLTQRRAGKGKQRGVDLTPAATALLAAGSKMPTTRLAPAPARP